MATRAVMSSNTPSQFVTFPDGSRIGETKAAAWNAAAFFSAEHHLASPLVAVSERCLDLAEVTAADPADNEAQDRLADDIAHGKPGMAAHVGVGVFDHPVGIHDDHALRILLDGGRKALYPFPRAASLRHIAKHALDAGRVSGPVVMERRVHLADNRPSVATRHGQFEILDPPAVTLQFPYKSVPPLFGDQIRKDSAADDGVGFDFEHALQRRRSQCDAALQIDTPEHVAHILEQSAKIAFRCGQRLLDFVAFRDVADDRDDLLLRARTEDHGIQRTPNTASVGARETRFQTGCRRFFQHHGGEPLMQDSLAFFATEFVRTACR